MDPQPLAAAAAWFALGASFLGATVTVLFNPQSPEVRWYAVFWLALMVWLGAQGWAYAVGDWAGAGRVVAVATHLAPGLFLAFALRTWRRGWYPWAAAGAALFLLPLQITTWDAPYSVPVLATWNASAWILATAVLIRAVSRKRRRPGPKDRTFLWLVVGGMAAVLPIGLAGPYFTEGGTTVLVLPLLMVWIHLLSFVGIVRLRFYDVEVRTARSGETAAAAVEAERLAVVGELAVSLAHEIRNPLTGVRSLAQRLAEETIDENKRRRYAEVILEETSRVERLVANLLGVARRPRPEPGGSVRTELEPLFEDLRLLLGSRAEKAGIRLTAETDATSAPAAREPLAQALLNLMLNAVSHTPPGGAVHLVARDGPESVELIVRDTGPGIPPEDRERIWEPFQSGSGGTGLGLAVVRRLAREHGWRAEADEAPGGGAEFRLRIPQPRSTGVVASTPSLTS